MNITEFAPGEVRHIGRIYDDRDLDVLAAAALQFAADNSTSNPVKKARLFGRLGENRDGEIRIASTEHNALERINKVGMEAVTHILGLDDIEDVDSYPFVGVDFPPHPTAYSIDLELTAEDLLLPRQNVFVITSFTGPLGIDVAPGWTADVLGLEGVVRPTGTVVNINLEPGESVAVNTVSDAMERLQPYRYSPDSQSLALIQDFVPLMLPDAVLAAAAGPFED